MLARLVRAWRATHPWLWQIASLVLLAGFTISVVRPWTPLPPDPTGADVAAQWDESISRLGIEPVYPPQEDIYVGDVFAIVTGAGSVAGARTFIGASVKLDHVSVRWAFNRKDDDLPTFPETTSTGDADHDRQDRDEVDPQHRFADDPIRMNLVAFPGVTIVHDARSLASLALGGQATSARSNSSSLEEIHIPVAETYGMTTPDAVSALDQWCDAPQTRPMCNRDFAIKMLSFVLGRHVLEGDLDRPGNRPTVGLLLVGRVYAAREFDIRRSTRADRGETVRVDVPPRSSRSTADLSDAKMEHGEATDAAGGSTQRETMAASRSAATSEGVRQVFERPVVFGFRSVKRDLE